MGFIKDLLDSAASLGRVALLSRRASRGGGAPAGEEMVILGNGPSLRHAIDTQMAALMSRQRMAVNFAANAPEFADLRPQYYILADPHFFAAPSSDPNVERLWRNLSGASWPMVLYVPCKRRRAARRLLREAPDITLRTFNMTPAEGLRPVAHLLFRLGLGMPRPRNVLIPAIMCALRAGFRTIYLCGADHTWSRTLGVDDQNRVVSVQPHFYRETASEQMRVNTEYAGYHLHHILRSLYIAFRSYHQIEPWAARLGARILNATPGSMIDAFPRTDKLG